MHETVNRAEDEVVQICQDLIRIDTSNFGDGSGPGEAQAAAYVVESLREVGLEPQTFESDPGRVSVALAMWDTGERASVRRRSPPPRGMRRFR